MANTTTTSYANLSGPDFLKFSRQQINALSLDELQLLVLRSQRLLSTALFKPVQCLFEVMPDEFVIEIFLEWLYIEELASLDRALTNHYYHPKYLHLLQETEHKGVLSVSRNVMDNKGELDDYGYDFSGGLPEWLENRHIFMRELRFFFKRRLRLGNRNSSSSNKGAIPEGFLARTGQQLLALGLSDFNSDCDMYDEDFAQIVERCPKLEEMDFSDCMVITDVGALSLVQFCPMIHTLCVSRQVTDSGLARLGEGCKALRTVNLIQMMENLSDTGLDKLAELCPSLEELNIKGCSKITDAGVSSLAQYCAGLHTLNLNEARLVTDIGLARLVECCKALKTISLRQVNISDTGVRQLAVGCPMLQSVNLACCEKITDDGLSSLAACSAMKEIGCYNLLGITDEALRKLAEGCPSLEVVNLCHCTQITDAGVSSLAQYCAGLHTLDLEETRVTDIGLARLGEGCKALKKINVNRANISDIGLCKLAEGCPSLESVNLSYCTQVTDAGVSSLAQYCAGLKELYLAEIQVTDFGLARLGEGCKALKEIDLRRQNNITDTGLCKLAEGCPRLEYLFLADCGNISDYGATSLMKFCPRIHDVDLGGTQLTSECKARLREAYPSVRFFC